MVEHRKKPIVAIDGPAGAGKSTVSHRLAELLGYLLLDTGALYRCVGLAASRAGVLEDPGAVGRVAHELAARNAIVFTGTDADGVSRVKLDGEDVSEQIRSPEAGQWASRVSAIPSVRDALLDMQRAVGRSGGVVVEGRDIGTVVFPDAEAKFFLTATVEARALRRHQQLASTGAPTLGLAEIEQDVRARDRRDSTRPVAPLKCADDALIVESTTQSFDDVVALLAEKVRAVEARLASTPRTRS